MKISLKKRI